MLGTYPGFCLADVKWSPDEMEGGGLLNLEHTACRSGYLGLLYQSCILLTRKLQNTIII